MRTPIPPFEPGEEVAKSVPAEWMKPAQQRIEAGEEFDVAACVWLCTQTKRCLHYDFRPEACRKFEIGSDLCRLSRWDEGVDR